MTDTVDESKKTRAGATEAEANEVEATEVEATEVEATEIEGTEAEASEAGAASDDVEAADAVASEADTPAEVVEAEALEAGADDTADADADEPGESADTVAEADAAGDETAEDDQALDEAGDAAAAEAEPSPEDQHAYNLRLVEALIFASATTLGIGALSERLPPDTDVEALLAELAELYAARGVNLVKVAGGYGFRTAPDLAQKLKIEQPVNRKLSRAAVDTLAIIAYHQPVTRAEIEQIRGVGLSKGTLDFLFEQNWIQPMGRRRAPGKPVTWGTTEFFLEHFGLGGLDDLPGHEELKAAGLLDARAEVSIYRPEEPDLPLDGDDEETAEPLDTGAEEPAAPKTPEPVE
ncbi:SMC-Scp complex subunit ScpB [Vineibacter terrae]|uniref:SMC-Scp complex subunit ScpB n=1 Tax=Vineibacter terrae TaxID=2586908 RepID=UPI002E35B669|nr:SMC-Scp complex subunit ScpB [Vineibacter terrae]HEX2889326.1 SMC-Scp complex subunit ScpB [Vineibacter terrae]